VVLRDITERKQAHDELRRAHDLFRDTFEHASVGIAHVGVDGAWLNVNQTLCDMLGYSAKELLKTTFIGITRPDDIAEGAEQLRQLLRGDASTYAVETRYVRRDGGASWFALNVAVIRAKNGAAEYFVAVLTDISERKHNEELLAVQLARIEKTLTSVLDIANNIVEERDPYTAGHERRVAELATRIAQDLKMSDQDVDDIRVAGLLHDIGKVSVPAEILSKPGVLSEVERDLIRVHAEAGAHIVSSAHMEGPIAELVYQHHERCDGSGYPRGLSGDRISAGAKVIAVADVIEAMMSHRPYRAALGLEAGLAEIENGAGRLYGADAARSCVGLFRSGRFEFSDYASEPASVGTP
jgi:PAS domain S-box-containing protein/putative nucleotidyltransferase with HDIG domain